MPEPGNVMIGCVVLKIPFNLSKTLFTISANSGPRWSIVGELIALKTRSGILVGPGTCNKCLPDRKEFDFAIKYKD